MSDVEVPAATTSPEETPETPETSEEAVEPRLGLQDFLAVQPLREAPKAALTRWMRLQGHNIHGHYSLAEWQTYTRDMLAHVS